MDAVEDADLQVQRTSPALLAEIRDSLEPFLWRIDQSKDGSGGRRLRIRRRVRTKETDRVIALLEPFQELPQLLDPHLQTFVPILADAFIDSLRSKHRSNANQTKLLMPVLRAISKILYTLCKIRGEKIIVRFLSTDTKHLELLLSAIETGNPLDARKASSDEIDNSQPHFQAAASTIHRYVWEWEERYITLLWLSQLLLAPFDLSTLSSVITNNEVPPVENLVWPPKTPGVTFRVLPLALRYLSSSGKERDAAKTLLVRIAIRRDMQELGVLHALIQWAISCFDPNSTVPKSSYHYIGVLSFLAGILNASMSTSDMDPYLISIFEILQGERHKGIMNVVHASVLARKVVLKVLRNISVIVLRSPNSTDDLIEIVESNIGVMFESLADVATPVRIAASKALSLITMKLPAYMATQVVGEVITSLQRDIFFVERGSGKVQDLSRVNPSEWHGLILTLSQLLYRRSPPVNSLSDIIPALLAGLSFEQRATTGASVGTNVRDAACFGVWALSRRYTTRELQEIGTSSSPIYEKHGTSSLLQILATELVTTASLDPEGNVRRGASAALQELIGRHPNTITEGIKLVQTVDYHAVALRSRAANEVAVKASQLSNVYLMGILHGILGWRGIGDGDASARRTASMTFGSLAGGGALDNLVSRLRGLKPREDDERHGILLCMAAYCKVQNLPFDLKEILHYAKTSKHRRPDLIAEAVSRLIVSISGHSIENDASILELLGLWLRRNETDVIVASTEAALRVVKHLQPLSQEHVVASWVNILAENQSGRAGQGKGIISALFGVFPFALTMQTTIIDAIHKRWSTGYDIETRVTILQCLTTSNAILSHMTDFKDIIIEGLDDYTTNARGDVGSLARIKAVKAAGTIWKDITLEDKDNIDIINDIYGKCLRLAAEKLDKIRIEAQQVISYALPQNLKSTFNLCSTSSEAYFSLLLDIITKPPVYFLVTSLGAWQMQLLSGLVGSLDTGSEELVRASRSALTAVCDSSPANRNMVCATLYEILKVNLDNDRLLIPTMEVLGFLFDVQILQQSSLNWRSLYIQIQKAHYKTGNVRKLEAAIRVYGGLSDVYPEAMEKLTSMALHPFPKVRNHAVDTLFIVKNVGKGVNWLKASKADLAKLK